MHRQDFTRLGVPVLAAIAIGSLATSAFAQSSTIIVAPSAPPPPRVETMPPPPPPTPEPRAMTWQAGHWAWNGTAWAWAEGQYVQRPQPTAEWEPGHWALQPAGGYVWVDGRWRS
jgi:hypothetical protein